MKIFAEFYPAWLRNILNRRSGPAIPEKTLLSGREMASFEQALISQAKTDTPIYILTEKEKKVAAAISKETEKYNRNNITRTKAYLLYYRRNPDLHWAFLAHMVSRNGGYYMTDIKSSYLDGFLTEEDQERYFLFLERCNAYIFQDAYPQLLLLEYSRRLGIPLFHLLPKFHVSGWMKPFWNHFYEHGSSAVITAAMIVNEQKMLEDRVIGASDSSILDDLPFLLQEKLGFTTVVFPLKKANTSVLLGVSVMDFKSADARITTGKSLYQILFHKKHQRKIKEFALGTPHTASRSDYWSSRYSAGKESGMLYSPALDQAWKDRKHYFTRKTDWFIKEQESCLYHLDALPETKDYDLTRKLLKQHVLLSAADSIAHQIIP
ncbi:DUF2515 domain-containing protein [Bacillus infantis]|nr:DUF2515 domain-containing protein [Bacillus infantis]